MAIADYYIASAADSSIPQQQNIGRCFECGYYATGAKQCAIIVGYCLFGQFERL